MRKIALLLLSGGFVACATNGDLVANGGLSATDQQVVVSLAERAAQVCMTTSYIDGPSKQPTSGKMPAQKLPQVSRFYRSSSSWVRGGIIINSVWTNVYFDPPTARLDCNDDEWQKRRESRTLYFDEVLPVKTSQQVPSALPEIRRPAFISPSTNSPSIEARLKQLKSLFDQGLLNESEYRVKQKQILDGI